MLDTELQQAIIAVTRTAWQGHVAEEAFLGMFAGKERGHRIADFVEEKTVACLEAHFDVAHEVTAKGKPIPRGMGDAWIRAGGIAHPVNVKAGVHDVGGQPNVVSLSKLTVALLDHRIDSYYLLLEPLSE